MFHEQSLPRTIKNAWIGALTSIIILIPVTIFTGLEQLGKLDPKLIPAFVILLIAYTIASSYILWGFAQLGNHFTNKLLSIGSLILLVSNILVTVYYILYYVTPYVVQFATKDEFLNLSIIITGLLSLPFGIGILQLKKHLGDICLWVGILELCAAALAGLGYFLTSLLELSSLVLLLAMVLEVMIIYDAHKKFPENK